MFSLDGFSLRSILLIAFDVGVASLRFRTSLFKLLRLTLRAFARRIRRRIALGKCTRDQQQRRDCGDDQQAHGQMLLLAGQSNPGGAALAHGPLHQLNLQFSPALTILNRSVAVACIGITKLAGTLFG